MIELVLFAVAILSGSAGVLGHPPLLPRLCRQLAALRPQRVPRGFSGVRTGERPADGRTARTPAWAHTEPHTYEEAA